MEIFIGNVRPSDVDQVQQRIMISLLNTKEHHRHSPDDQEIAEKFFVQKAKKAIQKHLIQLF